MRRNRLQVMLVICIVCLCHFYFFGVTDRRIVVIPNDAAYTVMMTNMNTSEIVAKIRSQPEALRGAACETSVRGGRNLGWDLTEIRRVLGAFHHRVETERRRMLVDMQNNPAWTFRRNPDERVDVIHTSSPDVIKKLNKLKFLRTVTLEVDPWILRTLPNPVYGYSSNDCAFIESSTFPDQDARRVYGATCSPSLCAAEQTLRLSAFSAFDCCTTPSTETRMVVAYVNVMRNAYVNRFGDAHVNNVKLIPVRCEPEFKVEANYIFYPNYLSKVPVYHEVLSVATFWGDGYYHAMVEEMARLAPYVPFLRANQGIKVHVQSRMSFVLEILELLGIGSDRVIDGPIRARSLYVPNGLRCDAPNAFNVLLLRHLLLKYTGRDRDLSTSKNHPPRHLKTNASKYLILIKRTKKRKFNHHEKIRDALRRVATRRSHGVEVFSDEALPPLVEAARLFRDASLVVAPHGAGLTNMLFSTPGTTVVEALCFNASAVRRLGYHGNHVSFPGNAHTDILNKLRSPANQRSYVTKVVSPSDNILRSSSNQLGSLGNKLSSLDNSSPDDRYAWIVAVNMQLCYRNLAHILGLRYYGLVYPDRHCNDTTAADLAGVVSALLSQPHIDLV